MLAVFLYEHGSENNSDARMSWGLARVPWVSRAPDVSLELSMCHTSHLLELKKKNTLEFLVSRLIPLSLLPSQQCFL